MYREKKGKKKGSFIKVLFTKVYLAETLIEKIVPEGGRAPESSKMIKLLDDLLPVMTALRLERK